MLVRGKGYGLINPVKVHFTALKVAAIVYHAIALHFRDCDRQITFFHGA